MYLGDYIYILAQKSATQNASTDPTPYEITGNRASILPFLCFAIRLRQGNRTGTIDIAKMC